MRDHQARFTGSHHSVWRAHHWPVNGHSFEGWVPPSIAPVMSYTRVRQETRRSGEQCSGFNGTAERDRRQADSLPLCWQPPSPLEPERQSTAPPSIPEPRPNPADQRARQTRRALRLRLPNAHCDPGLFRDPQSDPATLVVWMRNAPTDGPPLREDPSNLRSAQSAPIQLQGLVLPPGCMGPCSPEFGLHTGARHGPRGRSQAPVCQTHHHLSAIHTVDHAGRAYPGGTRAPPAKISKF